MSSKKLFSNPKEVFEEQINDLFLTSDNSEVNHVIRALSLILYAEDNLKNKNDFLELYSLLGLEGFVSVISLFEKRTITFPSMEEIKEDIILSVIFYYKEIKNYSWNEIKKIVPFEFSSISYAFKLKKLNSFIQDQIREIFEGDIKDVK